MKLLFFSDVHGVPSALKKLFSAADALCPDRLLFLGDALYHGPRNGVPDFYDPVEAATLLNAKSDKILAVRGNCDSEVDQMMLRFPMMADYTQLDLPARRFFLTHGHLWNAAHLPPVGTGNVLAHGHTHIPGIIRKEEIIVFNPGSISLTKNGFPATFGFYDGEKLSVRKLENGETLFSE